MEAIKFSSEKPLTIVLESLRPQKAVSKQKKTTFPVIKPGIPKAHDDVQKVHMAPTSTDVKTLIALWTN